MELISSWERKGIEQGIQQGLQVGKEILVIRQLNRSFGSVMQQIKEQLDTLPADKLDELGVALLDFTSVIDLENWLSDNS